jgi:hypothetical protein
MIPEFDDDGLAMVPLDDGRAMSINNEERTAYIRSQMLFMYDPAVHSTAADATSYEVAFVVGPDEGPDRGFIPPGWEKYQDDVRTDSAWRIQVVHDYLDEHAVAS